MRIVVRVRDVPSPSSDHLQADGPGVTVAAVPDYLGPTQYLCKARAVHRALRHVVGPEDAVILRVPSHLANCIFPALLQRLHPYAVEVVGDPWDMLSPGTVRHWLRPFFRHLFTSRLRSQCARACAAAYVTEFSLQRRYPVAGGALISSYSSVDLPPGALKPLSLGVSDVEISSSDILAASRQHYTHVAKRMVYVGSLSQLYKAPDVLLKAMARCVRDGLDVWLTIVGDGQFRVKLQRQAARLGLGERVVFRGQLTIGDAVRKELDAADLFVLPSRQEGLPRAMIEAMARGLPCIGSNVGGIPELLPPEDMVPPGNPLALARKIEEVLTDPVRMHRMATRNLKRAGDYREASLCERRLAFYRFVRESTEAWIDREQPPLPVTPIPGLEFVQPQHGNRRKSA